jgi:DNA-binding NarL/FixJ family response regulator
LLRVLLADDCAAFRSVLREYLLLFPLDFSLTAEACDGHEVVKWAQLTNPDVIVVDVKMPGIDGLEAVRLLRASGLQSNIIVCTSFDSEEVLAQALEAGADAYLKKPIDFGGLGDLMKRGRRDPVLSIQSNHCGSVTRITMGTVEI